MESKDDDSPAHDPDNLGRDETRPKQPQPHAIQSPEAVPSAVPSSTTLTSTFAPITGDSHTPQPLPPTPPLPGSEKKHTTFGQYLKRFRSTINLSSSSSKARKTGQDDTAAAKAPTRTTSALSWLTNSRTTTPNDLRQQDSNEAGSPDFSRLTAPSPDSPAGWRRFAPRCSSRTSQGQRTRTPDAGAYMLAPGQEHHTSSQQYSSQDLSDVPRSFMLPPLPTTTYDTSPIPRFLPDPPLPPLPVESFFDSTPRHARHAPNLPSDNTYISTDDLPPIPRRPTPPARVEKIVKMRIHWHCHKCSCAVGSNGICIACGHEQCSLCTRKTGGRSAHEKEQTKKIMDWRASVTNTTMTDASIEKTPLLDSRFHDSGTASLRREKSRSPSPTIADLPNILSKIGSAFRRSSPTNRVRRLCHQCHTPFLGSSRHCGACDHQQCSRCPKEAATSTAAAAANPTTRFDMMNEKQIHKAQLKLLSKAERDVEKERRRQREKEKKERSIKTPRYRIKYTCDICGKRFGEGTKVCECGHQKCDSCGRWPYVSSTIFVTRKQLLMTLQSTRPKV